MYKLRNYLVILKLFQLIAKLNCNQVDMGILKGCHTHILHGHLRKQMSYYVKLNQFTTLAMIE